MSTSQLHEILLFPSVGDAIHIATSTPSDVILYRCQVSSGEGQQEWQDDAIEAGLTVSMRTRSSYAIKVFVVFQDANRVNSASMQIEHRRGAAVIESKTFDGTVLTAATHRVHEIRIDAIVG